MATAFFVLVASAGAILVHCHGLLGTGSWFTGGFLALSTIGLFSFSRWRNYRLTPSDAMFAVFAGCAALSFSLNGFTTDAREVSLFILSLAAYPASRLFANGEVKSSFIWGTARIVGAGVTVTALALISQWDSRHGKPMVFGEFDAAPMQFLTSLGFLIIASVCANMTLRRTIIICALIFFPVAIFAASMVRFTFLAIAGGLALAAFLTTPRDRKYVCTIMLVMFVAVGGGLWARSATTMKYLHHEIAGKPIVLASAGDAFLIPVLRNWLPGCANVDGDNSIAIRKQIYREARDTVSAAGPFGIGLDGFMRISCVPGAEVHNSVLQVTIELGWLAGVAFASLIIVSAASLLPFARHDLEVRFALCSLIYLVLLSMAHGRISRDALLFLFLGYAAGIYNGLTKSTPAAELLPATA